MFAGLVIGALRKDGRFNPGQPIVRRINSRQFQLVRSYEARWKGPTGTHFIHVPQGYQCDLASIPRAFHVIVPKGGLHDGPSCLHDWVYEHRTETRAWADDLFLAAMKVAGVHWLRRTVMYAAVRAFGWYLWNRHLDANSTGKTKDKPV